MPPESRQARIAIQTGQLGIFANVGVSFAGDEPAEVRWPPGLQEAFPPSTPYAEAIDVGVAVARDYLDSPTGAVALTDVRWMVVDTTPAVLALSTAIATIHAIRGAPPPMRREAIIRWATEQGDSVPSAHDLSAMVVVLDDLDAEELKAMERDYSWIRVPRLEDDKSASAEARLSSLERHHTTESTFLIGTVRRLAAALRRREPKG